MLALDLVIRQFAEAVRRSVVQQRRTNVNICSCTMRHFDEVVTVNKATSAQSATDCAYRKCEQGWCLAQHRRSPKRHALPVHDRDGLRFGLVDLGLDEVEANLRTCPACRSVDKVQLANTPCSQVRRRSLGHDTRRLHPPYSHVVAKVSARKRNAGSDHPRWGLGRCEDWSRQLRTGCLSILMLLTPLAEVTP